jgi:hypothetical protein
MNPTPSFPNEALQMDAFPATEQQTAFIQSAHFGEPQNSYAPIGRQHGEYEIFTEDALSLDDISSDLTWKARNRFTPTKSKGKARGKGSKSGRGKMNASSPYWDKACTVIPKFGAQLGILLYAIGDLKMPHLQYAV